MSLPGAFEFCVERTNEDGRYQIECRLGLWSVDCATRKDAEREAFRYWVQYYTDGEYAAIGQRPSQSEGVFLLREIEKGGG